MQLNGFSAGRRLAAVIALGFVAGVAVSYYLTQPSVTLTYIIAPDFVHPAEILALPNEKPCDSQNLAKDVPIKTSGDHVATAQLCYLYGDPFETGAGILYRVQKGPWKIASSQSPEVVKFVEDTAAAFGISTKDATKAEQQYQKKLVEARYSHLKVLLSGLVALWLFVVSVGWISRGLLDVPRGKDRRPIT